MKGKKPLTKTESNMKMKQIELGNAEDKPDSVLLYGKAHCRSIILKYSFEELEKLIKPEMKKETIAP